MKVFLFFTILFSVVFSLSREVVIASSDSLQINQNVVGCNNNSICEPVIGEDAISCPNDCVTITPTPPQGGGGHIPFLYDVVAIPLVDRAIISFKTLSPTFATITWGETGELKSGVNRSIVFVTNHSSVLTGLKPGTQYFFLIVTEGKNVGASASYGGAFVTLSIPEQHIVPNPSNVRAGISEQGITLKWDNPIDSDFDYIRIMRNADRFRSNPFSGTLVYEGTVEHFLDKDIVNDQTYYYTLFTRETSGRFSSGVGVKAIFNPREDTPVTLPPPKIKEKDFLPHFLVVQKGQIISPVGNIREITGADPVNIQSVSETFLGFDDLWMEVTEPSKVSTRVYLFTYDSQKKLYQASIPPLFVSGDYQIRIYGFNQDHTALLSEGILRVPAVLYTEVSKKQVLPIYFWLTLLLVLIIWVRKVLKDSK